MNYKNYEMTQDTAGKKFCLNCRPSYTILAFCNTWSHDQFSVNTKTIILGKIILAGIERAFKI